MDTWKQLTTPDHGGGSSDEPLINLLTSTEKSSNNDKENNEGIRAINIHNTENSQQLASTSGERPALSTSITEKNTTQLFSQVLRQKVLTKVVYPKKDQAILFSSLDNIPIKDYIINLGKIIGPKNVTFASKISNNRVCIYLASKECVNNFMTEHGGITIGDVYLTARRLITPANRLILSNVSPIIPHETIEEALKSTGLKIVSPVSFIGVGLGLPEYAHIYSFRRQVYALPDGNELPSSLIVSYDGDNYRVFLSNGDLKCFTCKATGHMSKNCPNLPTVSTETGSADNAAATSSQENILPREDSVEPSSHQQQNAAAGLKRLASSEPLDSANGKRVASTEKSSLIADEHATESSTPQPVTPKTGSSTNIVQAPKRRHKQRKPDPPEALNSLQEIFQAKKFALTFEDFKAFLNQVKGRDNPGKVVRNFTDEIPPVIEMLQELIPFIETRSIKERCRRLVVSLSRGGGESMSLDSSSESTVDMSF